MYKILVADPLDPSGLEILREAGAEVHIPAKKTPFFKVGKELKEMVDAQPTEPGAAAGDALG